MSSLLPTITTTTTATHHTHLLYLLGRETRRESREGGVEGDPEKKNKSRAISSLKWACWGVRNGERERKDMYNKDKGVEKDMREILQLCVCNEKWWVFDSSPLQRWALAGVGGLHFFPPLHEESYPNETETRHSNWQEALKAD